MIMFLPQPSKYTYGKVKLDLGQTQ